jgi:dipeptidase D
MGKEAIEGLKPEKLWEVFYDITQIPRCSKHEEKIRAYVRDFAKQHGLDFKEDETGNIVIEVPASAGKENVPKVILQGHVDMVCEKNKSTEHDFANDPLKVKREGEWITAEGTTLGADNGIGVAAAMAVALDKEAVHGPMQILCTVDEETGMTGVSGLQPGFIEGKYLLNLDSEEDGIFYVGCAGGQDTVGTLEIDWQKCSSEWESYELLITGLSGGHSGLDIHQGRGNAIKILAYLLTRFEGLNLKAYEIFGGSLRNAIPREAGVKLFVEATEVEKIKTIIETFHKEMMLEYKITDPGLAIKFEKLEEKPDKTFSTQYLKKIVNTLLALPHGVISMSKEIPGLVETSTNLATIKMDGAADVIVIGTSQRSSIESAKNNISRSVAAIFSLAGAEVKMGDGYPGWTPNMESPLLKTSVEVYSNLFGGEPEIKAIHAGLETGLLGSKYPGLDMISFGPTIEGAHSPNERVNIPAVEKFYKLLKGILEKLTE